ncbi:TIM barrel protein [Yoonia sp. SS1-5]|uniref:Hydroxypyruvate isomerase family protein n=1 Tax=Yoonia rhodophyticola TaxID=3137370 RepID=A0AAN0MFY7_9RHOB
MKNTRGLMPKFCANLTYLFQEIPFMERFTAAKEAGFDAVEVLEPYDVNAQDVVNEMARYELQMALISSPPPNYTGGERGWAAVPDLQQRFQRDFKRALRYAKTLGASHVQVAPGVATGDAAHAVFVENLRWAAAEAPKQILTIKPVAGDDFLSGFDLAREVLAAVGADNVRLQFSVYEAARLQGDPITVWKDVADLVAHVQVAQLPDETEPDKGEIDYPAFFAMLDADGYDGWVSGAYHPKITTQAGLAWVS